MEKQLLFLLDWNLKFQPSELQHHLEPFLIRTRDSTARIRGITYRDSQEIVNKRKPRGKFQSLNTNKKIPKPVSERRKAKQMTRKVF